MIGNHDFFERLEERSMNRSRENELLERIERERYHEYQKGQMEGFKEGEAIGYERGAEDTKKAIAEKLNLSMKKINKILAQDSE